MSIISATKSFEIEKHIIKFLKDCPKKVYFDDRFSFFQPTAVEDEFDKFDILYIEKHEDYGFSVRINDEIFNQDTLDFLPANMIYLKLQTIIREYGS